MLGQSIKQNAIGLSLFAVVTAGIIAVTQTLTAEKIEHNIHTAKSRALYEILPPEGHDNVLLDDTLIITDPSLVADELEGEAFVARKGDGSVMIRVSPIQSLRPPA